MPRWCAASAGPSRVSVLFSEPKIPQFRRGDAEDAASRRFQCSSASRKFLIVAIRAAVAAKRRRFSALQRAENSSICVVAGVTEDQRHVSVLFSEPKIPQSSSAVQKRDRGEVSVLFSEPKIPQSAAPTAAAPIRRVSVLFSEPKIPQCVGKAADAQRGALFQCSSASRKFLNIPPRTVELGE